MGHFKKNYFEVVIFIFISLPVNSQSMKIDINSIGLIQNDSMIIGSGFVLDSLNQVITCAHVILNQRKVFYLTNDKIHELKVKKIDSVNDIAYLESDEAICETPLNKVKTLELENGQEIIYVGFDWVDTEQNKIKTIKVHKSNIIAFGLQANNGGNAQFIEFEGEGKPGYSGGPVFQNGEVLGLIKAGWYRKDLNIGNQTLINRAFLLK
ncbi:MAG TPA: serine protease [Saprospiraceae bacterium]|nr:serine protease [Saprospiraceae bacterium]